MRLRLVPSELREANAYVDLLHRHHKPVQGHRWSSGVVDEDGVLRGVAIVGRPKARMIDKKRVVEVVRVCTDGTKNACSFLYGAACRQQKSHGYDKAITYTLISESGISLRAAGWKPVAVTEGGSWSRPSRPRDDNHPLDQKVRWECRCSELPEISLHTDFVYRTTPWDGDKLVACIDMGPYIPPGE